MYLCISKSIRRSPKFKLAVRSLLATKLSTAINLRRMTRTIPSDLIKYSLEGKYSHLSCKVLTFAPSIVKKSRTESRIGIEAKNHPVQKKKRAHRFIKLNRLRKNLFTN